MRRLIALLALLAACGTAGPKNVRHLGYTPVPAPAGGGSNAWAAAAAADILTHVPTATQCEYIHFGDGASPLDSRAVLNPTVQGGGIGENSTTTWLPLTSNVWQHTKTNPWGVAWRGAFATAQTGHYSTAGISTPTTQHQVSINVDFDTSNTKFVLKLYDGTATAPTTLTTNSDTNVHDFLLYYDGTTVGVYIDGVLAGSTTTLTRLVDEAMFFGVFTSSGMSPAQGTVVQQVTYCYVPTAPYALEQFTTLPDGTIVPGTQMYAQTFDGSSLPAGFVALDDWPGNLNNYGSEPGCFRHEQVSVSGGALNLGFAQNARASCAPQWNCGSSNYQTNVAPTYPCTMPNGPSTSYDMGIVQETTSHLYGQWYIRAMMPAGKNGPGGDVTLWGRNCAGPNGVIAALEDEFAAKTGTTSCNWPVEGSKEFDIVQYWHSFGAGSNQIAASLYVDNSVGSPPSQGTFLGIPYYGWLWLENPISTVTDPSANWHTYELDWRPGSFAIYVDGVSKVSQVNAAVPSTPGFLMFWNDDQIAVDNTGSFPQTMKVDWVVHVCPPLVPCALNRAGDLSGSAVA